MLPYMIEGPLSPPNHTVHATTDRTQAVRSTTEASGIAHQAEPVQPIVSGDSVEKHQKGNTEFSDSPGAELVEEGMEVRHTEITSSERVEKKDHGEGLSPTNLRGDILSHHLVCLADEVECQRASVGADNGRVVSNNAAPLPIESQRDTLTWKR